MTLYEDMINTPAFQEQKRYKLSIEVMTGSYLDGKLVDELSLPENCAIINIHRDGKDAKLPGMQLIPGDQVDIELDAQDIESSMSHSLVWQTFIDEASYARLPISSRFF